MGNDPFPNNISNDLIIKITSSRKVRVPVQGIIKQIVKIATSKK